MNKKRRSFRVIGKTAFAILWMITKIKNGILMETLSMVSFFAYN